VMRRTPSERARTLWLWSGGVAVLGLAAGVVGAVVPETAPALRVAAPVALVAAVLLAGLAANVKSRRAELVWIVTGLGVFWVAVSALYLELLRRSGTELDDVPSEAMIALLSALFTAGTVALVAAVLVVSVAWFVRPGRWRALNGPDGQS
jgi:hypothetical protein